MICHSNILYPNLFSLSHAGFRLRIMVSWQFCSSASRRDVSKRQARSGTLPASTRHSSDNNRGKFLCCGHCTKPTSEHFFLYLYSTHDCDYHSSNHCPKMSHTSIELLPLTPVPVVASILIRGEASTSDRQPPRPLNETSESTNPNDYPSTQPPPVSISRLKASVIVTTVSSMTLLNSLLSGILTVGLPSMATDLGLSDSLLLWYVSFHSLVLVLPTNLFPPKARLRLCPHLRVNAPPCRLHRRRHRQPPHVPPGLSSADRLHARVRALAHRDRAHHFPRFLWNSYFFLSSQRCEHHHECVRDRQAAEYRFRVFGRCPAVGVFFGIGAGRCGG